ncbi:MAG: DoxX family membrane protein [Bacteroidota bacterium]
MNKITPGIRFLFGLIFLAFGAMGLFNLMPPPKPGDIPEAAMAFSKAMADTGYMLVLVKLTETLCGLLLLLNMWVPLVLVILFPVTLNILLFHSFLAPQGLPMAIVLIGLHIYLAFVHRRDYRALFVMRDNHETKQSMAV